MLCLQYSQPVLSVEEMADSSEIQVTVCPITMTT